VNAMVHLLFGFNGRTRRLHYWLASFGAGIGLSVVLMIVLILIEAVAGATSNGDLRAAMSSPAMIIVMTVLIGAYLVLAFWISLAIQIKRWHDRDKSGVWVLIAFIPFVGGLWTLIECGFLDGTEGPNRFGPSPKGVTGPPPVRV
jgi:uncharacterized membrane protein YhaH (DUF805 family)